MAGLDDYQFYTRLRDQENPFWERANPDEFLPSSVAQTVTGSSVSMGRPRDLPQKLASSRSNLHNVESGNFADSYAELSIGLVGLLADNLLSHPFIVLRRVCQVDVSSRRQHLLPVTVVYAAIKSQQGAAVLWKGLGSVLIVKGLNLGVEDALSKFTPLPKEVYAGSSLRSLSQHLLLKCCSLAIVTPFLAASLVETVQSSVAAEGPGVLDVFREGLTRLLSFTQPQTGRLLPIWLVLFPTVCHGLLQYVVGNAAATVAQHAIMARQQREQEGVKFSSTSKGVLQSPRFPAGFVMLECRSSGAVRKQSAPSQSTMLTRLQAAFVGHLAADVLLYPLETLVHRLQLQGTRTIIDSLDAGYEVKPILTRYEGFMDCLRTTLHEEGSLGLFKGFGALCLQYAVYGALLKCAHVIAREVGRVMADGSSLQGTVATPLAPTSPYTLPRQASLSAASPRHVAGPGYSSDSPPQHSSPARHRPPRTNTPPSVYSPPPVL